MDNEHAKPGDTIEITWPHKSWLGRRCVVIEPSANAARLAKPGDAWFMVSGPKEKYRQCFSLEYYKIVAKYQESSQTDIDESLRRQRDKNLRSVFL